MNFQQIMIVGSATDDAEKKISQKGFVDYVTFDVGVSDAKDGTKNSPDSRLESF